MGKPAKLAPRIVEKFISSHKGWKVKGDALEKTYAFDYYGAAIAFAVHVGLAADKRNHHPEMQISFGKVAVRWSTHDAGGITSMDTEMSELCEHAYR